MCFPGLGSSILLIDILRWIGLHSPFQMLSQGCPWSAESPHLFIVTFPQLWSLSPPQAPTCLKKSFPIHFQCYFFRKRSMLWNYLFSLYSTLPETSVILPFLPASNGITLWMWNLAYQGEVFGCRQITSW